MTTSDRSLRYVPASTECRSRIFLADIAASSGGYEIGVVAEGWTDPAGRPRASFFTPGSDRRLVVGLVYEPPDRVRFAVQRFRPGVYAHEYWVDIDDEVRELLESDDAEDRLLGFLAAVREEFEIEPVSTENDVEQQDIVHAVSTGPSLISEISALLTPQERWLANQWLGDGRGLAVYHRRYPDPGQRPLVLITYGLGCSVESDEPPRVIGVLGDPMADAFLIAHFRGEELP